MWVCGGGGGGDTIIPVFLTINHILAIEEGGIIGSGKKGFGIGTVGQWKRSKTLKIDFG